MAGKESLPRTTASSAQRKSRLLLTTDSSDKHNQAPGQVRGRATGGWPAGRDEWERTSQIRRQKKHGLDSLRECWICFGKDTRKRACGCFFTTSPRLETKRNPVFFFLFSTSCARRKKQGHLRSIMSYGVLQSRASSLAKGFESASPAWLAQAQPCASLPIRVNPCI